MKLGKDGETIVLTNQSHIDAYLSSGWTEVKEQPKKQTTKKN